MAVTTGVKRGLLNSHAYPPKGPTLPGGGWRLLHLALCYPLRAHLVLIYASVVLRRYGVVHSATEAGIVAIFASLATTDGRRRRFTSAMAALGLVMSSAVIVHLSGGVIEAHFHFFVMVGILTLYQDWRPFLIAI